MRFGRLVAAATLLAAVSAVSAASAVAAPVVRTFSSGTVARAIPDKGVVEVPIRVRASLPLAKLRVSLRITHPRDHDLVLHLIDPRGRAFLLAYRVGSPGRDFGAGPRTCRARMTTFEDELEYEPSIVQGRAPFADSFGSWIPGRDVGGRFYKLHGIPAAGIWRLRIRDVRDGAAGTLDCWRIETTLAAPDVSAWRAGRVRARLS